MKELEQKTLLVQRIIAHLNPVPADAVQNLLGQSLEELEIVLEKLVSVKALGDVEDAGQDQLREAQAQRASDAAWGLALAKVWLNGRRLCDVESNRQMLESLLNPGEHPTAAIYGTLALQFPTKFSWETPQAVKSAADREAEFVKVCHESLLSLCDANRQMFRDGVALENWAGASGLERAAFQAEAAQARQTFLINHATPDQLKAEARYQSATEHDAAVQAEADRRHQFVLSQQQGHYAALPSTNADGDVIDAAYLRKISTINFPLFKQLVKKHGAGNITSRLRGEN